VTRILDGEVVAEPILEGLRAPVETLVDSGTRPGLGTVLMSDDPADARFVELKHEAGAALGVDGFRRAVEPDAPAAALHGAIDDLNDDPDVHGVFVQLPLPDHVDVPSVRERVDPEKDVDCFHPANLGRLVAGDPRFEPATPLAILVLLAAAAVEAEGADVAIVGRSDVVGKPLANLLLVKGPGGNATVTVCHSYTRDLAAKTREADVVVAGAGVPGLIDGSMLSEGAVVIDASANRVERDDGAGHEVVGDVDYDSAKAVAGAITPVPGGVGPVTLALLLRNVVAAASRQSGTQVDRPRIDRP
jgi:methylenetetrahydrofolate dehydrogenase (NADP+)/methenyltetrahydrofolate cyclohydrolase